MADPLIAHRMKTLLFRVVDIHNNIFTTAIQVANKKYQREHFIPKCGAVPLSLGEILQRGNNQDK
ncbi:Uncharacterised protein [Escherichia coli]|uniref:Uncharacterized protein n=1 Tax=Escherichia coli TaxID=562 RepID=A0A377BLP5_ECOLX|nr:Uncharacterised protein [Escherichia coli]